MTASTGYRVSPSPSPLFWPLAGLALLQAAFALFWIATLGGGPDVQPTILYAATFAVLAVVAYKRGLPFAGEGVNAWLRPRAKWVVFAVPVLIVLISVLHIATLGVCGALLAVLVMALAIGPNE